MFHLASVTSHAVALLCVLCPPVGTPGQDTRQPDPAREQGAERTIKRVKFVGAPLALVEVKAGGQSLLDEERVTNARRVAEWREVKFDAGDDWLKDLTLRFKNVSGRTIVAMEVSFLVRHPNLQTPWALTFFPTRPVPSMMPEGGGIPGAEVLRPDEEITYRQHESTLARIDAINAEIKSRGATDTVSTIEISLGPVQGEDDTSWREGAVFRRDATNPRRWNVTCSPSSEPCEWRASIP